MLLFIFITLGCISSPDDENLTVMVSCDSAYHASIQWTQDGPDGQPVSDSDYFTKTGDYSLDLKGKNITVTAYAWKINPTDFDSELKVKIVGRNEFKEATTFYPDDKIGGSMTGAEDREFKE